VSHRPSRRSFDLMRTSVDVHGVPCPVSHCAAHLDVRNLTVKDRFTFESNRFNPCGDDRGDYWGGLTHRGRIRARKRWEARIERESTLASGATGQFTKVLDGALDSQRSKP